MKLPDYFLRLRCSGFVKSWDQGLEPIDQTNVLPEEAKVILAAVKVKGLKVDPEEFRRGLEVELEHGTHYPEVNVTNNHPY